MLGAPGLFKRSCIDGDCCSSFWEDLARPLARGVSLVSVYSKSDGVVNWRACLDPHAEQLEIQAAGTRMLMVIEPLGSFFGESLDNLAVAPGGESS